VRLIGQHSAKIWAKKRYSTAYLALKGCVKLKTVLARTVWSVRPSYIIWRTRWVPLRTSLLLFFSINYFDDNLVKETNHTLVGQAHNPMSMGELVRFLGAFFYVRLWWSWSKRLLLLWSYLLSDRCTVSIDSIHARLPVLTYHELFNYYNKYTRRYWSILGNEDVNFWVE
jgi:hypothetical protein